MINFRQALISDIETIFNLVNDEDIRKASFNSDVIDFETHAKWFISKKDDPMCKIYMTYFYKEFIGCVRFESMNHYTAIITCHVCKENRKKGYGSQIITKGMQMFRYDVPTNLSIRAYIKPDNIPSILVCRDSGFKYLGTIDWKNQKAIFMEQRRSCNTIDYLI